MGNSFVVFPETDNLHLMFFQEHWITRCLMVFTQAIPEIKNGR
jgi:hypothetical protein